MVKELVNVYNVELCQKDEVCSNTPNIAHTDITCCRYCMFYIMYTGYETGHMQPQTHN